MVALNGHGMLFLYSATQGTINSCQIAPPSSYQQIRVRMQGSTITVYANGAVCGAPVTNSLWPSGYLDLESSQSIARFEYLEVY
jgi:hypothetical protein